VLYRKIGATRFQILRLKCIKFHFRWGSAPYPSRGAYSAPQTPQLYLRGLYSKRRDGKEKGRGRKRERRWEGTEGKGGENDPVANSWLRHCTDILLSSSREKLDNFCNR